MSEMKTLPKVGKWPGIAGYTHDDDIYCVDCAHEMGLIDKTKVGSSECESVEYDSFRDAPHTGVALSTSEWDYQPHCGRMGDCLNGENGVGAKLPVRTIRE